MIKGEGLKLLRALSRYHAFAIHLIVDYGNHNPDTNLKCKIILKFKWGGKAGLFPPARDLDVETN